MSLDPATRALVRASAALAARDPALLTEALEAAAASASAGEVEEALLQSYLFLGYPAALNGLALWRELRGGAPAAAPEAESEPETWRERGARVCRRVYGGQYDRLRENVRRLHPEVERWMVTEGYGKVLGRPGLPLKARELCVTAILAVLGTPVQLYSHLRGALNAGVPEEEVLEALQAAGDYAEPETRRVALETWDRVRERAGGMEQGET